MMMRHKIIVVTEADKTVITKSKTCVLQNQSGIKLILRGFYGTLTECIFIDDVEKNVEGARRYGINALQFISVKQL